MKFISLKDLTYKQLFMQGLIALFFGATFGGMFIANILVVLGIVCLIWAGIKWNKEKGEKK